MHGNDSGKRLADWLVPLRAWAAELGFSQLGLSRAEVSAETRQRLQDWLAAGRHGEMDYMARHAALRSDPAALQPGSLSVISVSLPYWPDSAPATAVLARPDLAYISRYALGRDYHKILRQRLQKLADRLAQAIGPYGYRVFSDSAPVLEVEFAQKAALGWRGKHTLLLNRGGSAHFLGEMLTDLPWDGPEPTPTAHCGRCTACLEQCPTGAIVAPYQVDARRCISYLTIELAGPIPVELRPLLGNRIYGCDDCQLCCPWNRFAKLGDREFAVRHGLDQAALTTLFAWTETEFLDRCAGSPIRRIGHQRWLRNLAVALGNAPRSADVIAALQTRADHPSALVREHVAWALARQQG
jgi:epoxyqueuosine reductase